MNIEVIGAWGELIGGVAGLFAAVGVIVTLFYLARQVSDSVGMARASHNRGLQDSWAAYNNTIATSPELARVLAALTTKDAALSAESRVQARHICYSLMNISAAAEYSWLHGQINEIEFENHRLSFDNTLRTYPGMVPFAIEILELYPGLRLLKVFASVSASMPRH
ncbi:MAG: hypothetical protein H6993_01915 [Pseudomonadales bacterium]|nr:hypothetical protein [Pseudomonadales bacterium]